MAFWGNSFVFNDIPCDDYDLMLYDVGSTAQSSGNFASGVSIIEETLPSRYKPHFYGVKVLIVGNDTTVIIDIYLLD